MVLLNVFKLEKSYGTRTLFKDLSFGLESGEKVGLLGPNGVGKSTLLKILSGQSSSDAGQVSRAKGLKIGFLEQEPALNPDLSLLETLTEKSADPIEALPKAYEFLQSFHLDEFGEDFPAGRLSGGWKKRLALARELMGEPDLLFLDEPTNHLDVEGILWLENFIRQSRFAVMMVTHDRLFLQRTCGRILDLDPRNPHFLLDVRGNYVAYTDAKELIVAGQKRREDALSNKLRREKEWLSRGPQARQTKQKARIESAHALDDEVAELERRNRRLTSKIDFGKIDRLPKKLIFGNKISKSFGGKILFENLDLLIRPTTRLALMGENGSGKSTLIKCLLEMESVDSGTVERSEGIHIAYFEQNKETLDDGKSVLKNVCPEGDYVSFQGQFVHVRSYLDRFLFFGHHVDLPVSRLSGGERARLRLAQLMLIDAQVLILDEPTNDLDADTLDVLEDSLSAYNGAVILVTHDRYFMDAVCDDILAFPGKRGEPGQLLRFADYFQWENWHSGRETPPQVETAKTASASPKAKTKLSFKDKFELENMEKTILDMESRLAGLEQRATQGETTSILYQEIADLQAQIEAKYQRWNELSQKE